MEFKTALEKLKSRVSEYDILNEETTKTALVQPMFQALGYDTTNPKEFAPEYGSIIASKNAGRVDYAILQNDKPIILVECKPLGTNLDTFTKQCFLYFASCSAHFVILTNGVDYQIYSDIDKVNVMDEKPFLVFSLNDLSEVKINEFYKFSKNLFDENSILDGAIKLKHTNAMRSYLQKCILNPNDEFVSFLLDGAKIKGIKTANFLSKYKDWIKSDFKNFFKDMLSNALDCEFLNDSEESEEVEKIVTTEEEFEAYYIVKAIGSSICSSDKIYIRDHQSYCSVLYEDTNKKPICNFYFNTSNKRIEILDLEKHINDEKTSKNQFIYERYSIDSVNDIYNYKSKIEDIVSYYFKNGKEK